MPTNFFPALPQRNSFPQLFFRICEMKLHFLPYMLDTRGIKNYLLFVCQIEGRKLDSSANGPIPMVLFIFELNLASLPSGFALRLIYLSIFWFLKVWQPFGQQEDSSSSSHTQYNVCKRNISSLSVSSPFIQTAFT